MKIKYTLLALVASAVLVGLIGCATEEQKQAKLQSEAKISRPEAEKIALTKAPGGTIKDAELEKEKGKLIWSFDVATPGTTDITEVHVDAVTGQIVAVEKESAGKEAKEEKEKK